MGLQGGEAPSVLYSLGFSVGEGLLLAVTRKREADSAAHAGGIVKRLPRLFWFGLAALVLVFAGMLVRAAWRHHQFEKERTGTPPHVIPGLNLRLLWVPAGEFVMGTEEPTKWVEDLKGKYNQAKPESWPEWRQAQVHGSVLPETRVTLTKGFFLAATEISQGQWNLVMSRNSSHYKGGQLPVESLSCEDCESFCAILTANEFAAGRITRNQRFRLPTEAEWEFASTAGGSCCGPFFNSDPMIVQRHHPTTSVPVESAPANAWGFKGLHGSVAEYCADKFGPLPGGAVADPKGHLSGKERTVKGSSGCGGGATRSAWPADTWLQPDFLIGFRIVLETNE